MRDDNSLPESETMHEMVVWTGLIWLRIGTNGGALVYTEMRLRVS
jgi:hypothetical protein